MITVVAVVMLCALYGVASVLYSKGDKVYLVEAGCVSNASCGTVRAIEKPSKTVRLKNGNLIKTNDYIRIIIDGDCMTKKNVLMGEEWLVEPVNTSNLKDKMKCGDILLIYLEDKAKNKRIYKIREFQGFEADGRLHTQYYKGNEPQVSSKPHSQESVRGILRYCIG
jgi:hypothetical protein